MKTHRATAAVGWALVPALLLACGGKSYDVADAAAGETSMNVVDGDQPSIDVSAQGGGGGHVEGGAPAGSSGAMSTVVDAMSSGVDGISTADSGPAISPGLAGDPCRSYDQCIESSHCAGGFCARACGVKGDRCSNGSDCCGGACEPPNSLEGTCGAPVQCLPVFSPCSAGGECCSAVCTGGLCRTAGACSPIGAVCAGTADCCEGRCARNYLGPVKCLTCLPAGYLCKSSEECCDKACDHGICKSSAAFCERANGAACNTTTECCSQKCAVVDLMLGLKQCIEP